MTASLTGGRSGGMRIAFRIARRMAGQSRGRSALIALLVAIPVLGLVGITTVIASNEATPAERVSLELGATEARVSIVTMPTADFAQDPVDDRFFTYGYAEDAAQTLNPTPVSAESLFPPDTRLLSIRSTDVVAETKDGLGSFPAVQGQPWDPAFAGKWDVTGGSAPTADDEIMVTAAALDRLGAGIGGTATLTAPNAESFRIVGTLRSSSLDDDAVAFFGLPGAFDGALPDATDWMTQWYLPDTPLAWSQVEELNPLGVSVLSRSVLLDPPPADSLNFDSGGSSPDFLTIFIALLGGFALFEVALLAGAAFTVGARTQQRTLATLASVGGDRRLLFRVMSFGGIILGSVGAIVGTVLGLGGAWIFLGLWANGNASRYPGFHLDLVALLVIAALAVFAGWCAAAVPARAAGRIDVLAALRGAQRPPRVPRRRPVAAVVLLIAGAGITVIGGLVQLSAYGPIYRGGQSTLGVGLIIAGPVLMQIGAVFLAPGILRRAAKVASRWGPGARLSTRDVARNPGRSVPALAAIMSCVFVATFVMSLQASLEINSTRTYTYTAPLNTAVVSLNVFEESAFEYVVQSTGPEVAAALHASLPTGQSRLLNSVEQPSSGLANAPATTALAYPHIDPATLCPSDADRDAETGGMVQEMPTDIRCPTPPYLDIMLDVRDDHIWVGDVDDFAAILGEPVSAQSRETLAAGGAVSTYDEYLVDDGIRLDWLTELNTSEEPARSVTLAGSVQKPKHPLPYAIFMLPSTADALELDYRPTVAVSSLEAPPSVAELDQAQAALAAVSQDMSLTVEAGPDAYGATWSWALLALTAIIALVTATITIGLARADGHRDSAVLTSLGASPWVRRAFGFWQAVVVVGLGSVIGVLLGLMPSFALSLTRDTMGVSILPFAPPWLQLALMVLALPALVAVGAAFTAGGTRTRFSNRAVFD